MQARGIFMEFYRYISSSTSRQIITKKSSPWSINECNLIDDTMSIPILPNDIILLILHIRAVDHLRNTSVTLLQRAWRGYRTRVLLGRFRMLRYLAAFREWNPDITTFLQRARL